MTDIAVVGLDCRFPKADDPAALWQLLLDGADGIDEIAPERWKAAELHADGTVNHRTGGFISDADAFDNEFFGITPREAQAMDPQQRLLLQTAWRALEDATLDPRGQAGSNTGVFVGVMANEWAHLHMSDYRRDHRAGRVRQRLLHDRQPALLPTRPQGPQPGGRHRLLLVAGRRASGACRRCAPASATRRSPPASTSSSPRRSTCSTPRRGSPPPTARCKPFSGAADGIGRGEGVAVVVLRRLEDARGRGTADLRGDQGQRGQLRRPQQRHHRAQPVGAAAGGRRGLRSRRRRARAESASSRRTAPEPCSAT